MAMNCGHIFCGASFKLVLIVSAVQCCPLWRPQTNEWHFRSKNFVYWTKAPHLVTNRFFILHLNLQMFDLIYTSTTLWPINYPDPDPSAGMNSSTFLGPSLVCICPIGPTDPARDNSQSALGKICQDKGKETCSKVRDMCGLAGSAVCGRQVFPLIMKWSSAPAEGRSIPWPALPLSRLGGHWSPDIIPGPGGF